jgi:hypothetical protein
MTDNPYDVILDSVVTDADERHDDGPYVAAVEDATLDHLRDHFPKDESQRLAAAVGIVLEADAEPSHNWQKRVDDVEHSSPTEVTDALAADVIISDALA